MSKSDFGFNLYVAECRGNKANTVYPKNIYVADAAALRYVAERDHVCAEYQGGHRSEKNFMAANCLSMDCDNDHSENPSDWKWPEDIRTILPGVAFYAVASRNHMQPKQGRPPRPKHHYYFAINPVKDAGEYTAMKRRLQSIVPFFDENALDAARFFFGVENTEVEFFDGKLNLSDFLHMCDSIPAQPMVGNEAHVKDNVVIPQGSRNSVLSKKAGQLLKRYGDTDNARHTFDEWAAKCQPPLDVGELDSIYKSAQGFLHKSVKVQPGYIAPDEYNNIPSLEPSDYTDVGQAAVLAREYGQIMRYSKATRWIVYNGQVWEESDIKAQGLTQELTGRQLQEARTMLKNARISADKAAEGDVAGAREKAKDAEKHAEAYRAFILGRRKTSNIYATQTAAAPDLEISVDELDANAFYMNTPGGTVDLKTGVLNPHDPDNYCTKITAVSPSSQGADLWAACVDKISCGDAELAKYHQMIAGMFAVGKVFQENLIIAYGIGRNGKSTFYNTIARVLGNYAGNLSAETLTVNCRKNKSPEYAELRGKRLVIAAELEEGMRLDTAIVKKLCSTDTIYAEKKYRDPFSYTSSHTVVLFTNHLPSVGTSDTGTWRRLVVVPFHAVITEDSDIKNYADYLFEQAGGAVLAWIIRGAELFIVSGFRIDPPECVRKAIEEYKQENDWLGNFLNECCELNPKYREKSGELYMKYKDYFDDTGIYKRKQPDFNKAVEGAGYRREGNSKGYYFCGLRVASIALR